MRDLLSCITGTAVARKDLEEGEGGMDPQHQSLLQLLLSITTLGDNNTYTVKHYVVK